MLKLFGSPAHPHLINVLATFSWNEVDHILLPYADCNLRRFWETNDGPLAPASKTPQKDMLWIAAQMVGIVSALNVIHNVGGAPSNDRPFVRHGDIKPENILCFESSVDSSKILVLTDFGISSPHNVATELRPATALASVTVVYRAPESDMTDRARSRSYDIWGLGCLFLEMAAWVFGDLTGLEMVRREKGMGEPFFEVKQTLDGIDGKRQFNVKKEITEVSEVLFLLSLTIRTRNALT
jgi:serine/threonine protein kinase